MILDFHTHLGNILLPGGGELISAHIPPPGGFDPDALFRALRYHGQGAGDWLYARIPAAARALCAAERRRNEAATKENLLAQMNKHSIALACVMPIAPHVTFGGLSGLGERFLPFGSVDFTAGGVCAQVQAQLAAGAKGFKLHPIIQRVHPLGCQVEEFLCACPAGTVVMVHTGISSYYPMEHAGRERPEYGAVSLFLQMAARHPALVFIAAHGGLAEHGVLLSGLRGLGNVCVDTSFCQAGRLRAFYNALGGERLIFASDWPYGFVATSLACLKEAFGRDRALMERILWRNGAALLGI